MAMDESKLQFYSGFNYQKVFRKDTQTETVPVSGGGPPPTPTTVTIPHNLGRIPSVRVWYDPGVGKRFPISYEQYVDDTTGVSEVDTVTAQAHLTTTSLVLEFLNLSAASVDVIIWYRIYYDI